MRIHASEEARAGRRLTEAWPALEAQALAHRLEAAAEDDGEARLADRTLLRLGRLVDLGGRRRIVVIGCGERPRFLRRLLALGHQAVGIEPVRGYVQAAAAYLGREDVVLQGSAEDLPLPDASQDVVILENVLEHVDSVSRSLDEMYRVTAAGGVSYVKTNARHRLTGHRAEFRVRFYPWLPALVKECFVHHHLHHDPSLAAFSSRPAVHWFDFAQLCAAGREAGFARFYSLLDVVEEDDPEIRGSPLRRALLRSCERHPWLRALALTQLGGFVFMYKRPRPR